MGTGDFKSYLKGGNGPELRFGPSAKGGTKFGPYYRVVPIILFPICAPFADIKA